MNNQQIEQFRKILADAPEGATHYDGTYYRYEGYKHGQAYLVLKNGSWSRGTPSYPYLYVRSLADIRELESLRKQLATANQVVNAVDDAFVATQAGVLDVNNPRESIHKLIEVNMQIALDPCVSKDAAELVATAKADGVREAIEIAKAQEQFAIEQQIKALEAISFYFSSDDGLDRKVVSHIESEIEQLRHQAKGE